MKLSKRIDLPSLVALTLLTAPSFAQDSDGDGAPDAVDVFPCDPNLASVIYAPSQGGWTLLAFEDQWPAWTDLDFNDVVLRTHYRIYQDAQSRVRRIQAFFATDALGGVHSNGLGLQLPVPAAGATVRRRLGAGSWEPLSLQGDVQLTAIVSDNLRELFGGVADQINSLPGAPIIPGELVEVEITFTSPPTIDASQAPFDVFIFRAGDFGHQIHLPAYGGTAAMRSDLFGTESDASAPGRHFIHRNGTPFALNLQGTARYPLEGVRIDQLFPDIVSFASSGGAQSQDFYATNVVIAQGHAIQTVAPPAEPGPVDRSCIVTHQYLHADIASSRGYYVGNIPTGSHYQPCWTGYAVSTAAHACTQYCRDHWSWTWMCKRLFFDGDGQFLNQWENVPDSFCGGVRPTPWTCNP